MTTAVPSSTPPDMTPSVWLNELLLYRLSRLSAVAGSMVVRLCEGEFGITRREWRILGLLALDEGLPPSGLAQKAHLDKARTSRTISALVAKKLLLRTTHPADRRQAVLVLTDAGRALYAQLMPQVRHFNHELLQALQPKEVAVIEGLLGRLQEQAERMLQVHGPALPRTQRRKGNQVHAAERATRKKTQGGQASDAAPRSD